MTAQEGERPPEAGGAVNYGGPVRLSYRPQSDGRADAGEVVWAWVSYDDDPSIGKDRPLILIGWTSDRRHAALMLSSRDHQGDSRWMPIGRGPWDREGRQSWVRLDRLLAIAPVAVRREGAVLPRRTFDAIVAALRADPQLAALIVRKRPSLLGRLRRMLGRTP